MVLNTLESMENRLLVSKDTSKPNIHEINGAKDNSNGSITIIKEVIGKRRYVMRVERSRTEYNSLHTEVLVSCRECRKIHLNQYINHTMLFKLHVVSVEMYNTKYHIFHWFHVVSVERHPFPFDLQCIF